MRKRISKFVEHVKWACGERKKEWGTLQYRVFMWCMAVSLVTLPLTVIFGHTWFRFVLAAVWGPCMLTAHLILWINQLVKIKRRQRLHEAKYQKIELEYVDKITTLSLPGYYREHGWRGQPF